MRRELVPKPATLGAINLVQATPIATAVGVDGIFNKHRLLDRLNPTGSGFTTCTATSGSGLRIAGTRTTLPTRIVWLRGGDPNYRIVRGGSWRNESEQVRAAVRFKRNSNVRFDTLGFRVARTMQP